MLHFVPYQQNLGNNVAVFHSAPAAGVFSVDRTLQDLKRLQKITEEKNQRLLELNQRLYGNNLTIEREKDKLQQINESLQEKISTIQGEKKYFYDVRIRTEREKYKLQQINESLQEKISTIEGENIKFNDVIVRAHDNSAKLGDENSFLFVENAKLKKGILDILDIRSETWNFVLQCVMYQKNLHFVKYLEEFVYGVLRNLEANYDGKVAKLDIETREKIITECRKQARTFAKISDDNEDRQKLLSKVSLVYVFTQFLYSDTGTDDLEQKFNSIRTPMVDEISKCEDSKELNLMDTLRVVAKVIACEELNQILKHSGIYGDYFKKFGNGFTFSFSTMNKIEDIVCKLGLTVEKMHWWIKYSTLEDKSNINPNASVRAPNPSTNGTYTKILDFDSKGP